MNGQGHYIVHEHRLQNVNFMQTYIRTLIFTDCYKHSPDLDIQ